MLQKSIIQVKGKTPKITLDATTNAVYIRFSTNKVAKTLDDSFGSVIATIDVDSKGNVVGIELIGAKTITINKVSKILSDRFGIEPNLNDAPLAAC